MYNKNMLEHFITSKTKRKLLKLFVLHPDKSFYVRQIEKLTQEPVTAVRRELNHLEKAGFLKSRRDANLKYFEVDRTFPFYSELKKMIYSTIGLKDYLEEKLHDFDVIELAFIYGSVARNGEREQSDVDLLVVGGIDQENFRNAISACEKELGREINYTLMSRQEFDERSKRNDPFLKRVLREKKILLKGSLDDHREAP